MRICCKVVGNNKSFHLEAACQRYGWDTPETALFATSLCHSLNRQIELAHEISMTKCRDDSDYSKNVKRVERNFNGNKFGYVFVDVYSERRKGVPISFCRISLDDSGADVRTTNILPSIARFVYKSVWLLKKTTPPAGMESLRSLNLIRNFKDHFFDTHELYLEDGTVKEREKTPKAPKTK